MDLNYKRFTRELRGGGNFASTEEIMTRRRRAGACVICGTLGIDECGCIGMYLYKDKKGVVRLRRDKRSTLPYGIITNILCAEGAIEILVLHQIPARKHRNAEFDYPNNNETKLLLEEIIDLDIAVRGGADIDEEERRILSDYLAALENASDLGMTVDSEWMAIEEE